MMLLIGLLAGSSIGYLIARMKSKALHHSYQNLQKDYLRTQSAYETFQQNVSEHFVETAQLFNQLNDNYRAIHQHMAEGATTLCRTEKAITFADEALPCLAINNPSPKDYLNEPHPLREASS